MNKKAKKLSLNREVLRTVDPNELAGVAAGALNSSSDQCTTNCPVTGSRTLCFCPFCPSVPPANC